MKKKNFVIEYSILGDGKKEEGAVTVLDPKMRIKSHSRLNYSVTQISKNVVI